MVDDRDAVIARIRKLLALGRDGASAAESTSAVLMAQRLIVRYDVADAELREGTQGARRIVTCDSIPLSDGRKWRWELGDLVAASFRCKLYERTRRVGKNTSRISYRTMRFYGYEADAAAAALAFDYLYSTGCRLAQKQVRWARRFYGSAVGVYNSYIAGFLSGLRTELEKQSRELMVVLPLAVQEKWDREVVGNLHDLGGYHRATVTLGLSEIAEKGYWDGLDAVRARRLDDVHDFALPEGAR